LNHQGQCSKSLKIPRDLQDSNVEGIFDVAVNKNGYKYMECDDLELKVHIENLWMIIHKKTWLPTSRLISIAMAKVLTFEKVHKQVMNWALFTTWTKKEQVRRLLVKKTLPGDDQGYNFDEEEGNLDVRRKPVEEKVGDRRLDKIVTTMIE